MKEESESESESDILIVHWTSLTEMDVFPVNTNGPPYQLGFAE